MEFLRKKQFRGRILISLQSEGRVLRNLERLKKILKIKNFTLSSEHKEINKHLNNRKMKNNLSFPIKKGDFVKVESGITGYIKKYNSNVEIHIGNLPDSPLSIISKQDIVEVNNVPIEQLITVKISEIKTVLKNTIEANTSLLPKIKVNGEGWALFEKNEEGAYINKISPSFKTCFSFARYLKEQGLKVVNASILPEEAREDYSLAGVS